MARIAKDWKTAWDRKRSAEEELRKGTGEFEARDNALAASLLPREEALRALRALDVVGG